MAMQDVSENVGRLVELMGEQFRDSEMDIAVALAEADAPLSFEELAEETGYTERTVKKRTDTLEERLKGEPMLSRTDEGHPRLHPALARAIRQHESE